jgi:hypothetical protein
MDRLNDYRTLICDALHEIAAEIPPDENVRTEVNCNNETGHYELLEVGWDGPRRVHGLLVHCDLSHEKIIIEHDGTEPGLAHYLMQHGIPADSIVLGFHPPELRRLTPFAVR